MPLTGNNLATVFTDIDAETDVVVTKAATGEEQQVNQPGLIFNNAIFGQAFPTAPNYFASTRVTAGRRIQYVLNVTNTQNPEEVTYSFDYQDQKYLTGLPILAVLGARLEW